MGFIYNRVISIKRPGYTLPVGKVSGFVSQTTDDETDVVSDVPASIQAQSATSHNPANLPNDTGGMTRYYIFTKRGAIADGTVKNHDIVYDDLGRRFQIYADYTDSMGAKFMATQMEM